MLISKESLGLPEQNLHSNVSQQVTCATMSIQKVNTPTSSICYNQVVNNITLSDIFGNIVYRNYILLIT